MTIDQSGGDAGLRELQPLSSPPLRRPAQIGRITAVQARMARAALGRTQGDVATATGCAIKTIVHFEGNSESASRKNANVIRAYYESLGVKFDGDAYNHIVKVPK